ncbi:toxin-antitoxin system YwqK family antitoxin [Gynurincola endophyticus]|jgi:antitoxin component YwqK of YwqJK toxin-antitoxin module|uniref:hypothetical protein n=1 Tax=Gynurincola endophyticus TaxID=2479004 RepID=UPI000F8F7FDD|nr:hypothetical protein [Gynurincola endophyticus]
MRYILSLIAIFLCVAATAQWKSFELTKDGDTINRQDMVGRKHGPWVIKVEGLRGEQGYEEEGWFSYDKKEGEWRMFSLMGDLVGVENYKWGMKSGKCVYFTNLGALRLEQEWLAINPNKEYDTIMVESPDVFGAYEEVIVKNEGGAIKHGYWKYYDPSNGRLIATELYKRGELMQDSRKLAEEKLAQQQNAPGNKKEVPKPKEVLEFEKQNAGKKKIKVREGNTGGY